MYNITFKKYAYGNSDKAHHKQIMMFRVILFKFCN